MNTELSSNHKIKIKLKNKKPKENTESVKIKSNEKLLLIKKNIYGERIDLLTGESFIPSRSNQKFANSHNRSIYHNQIANQKVVSMIKADNENKQKLQWEYLLNYIELHKNKSKTIIIKNLSKKFTLKLL
jgi:prolyl oligopeptidase PreP (S9A serine peptidase family)